MIARGFKPVGWVAGVAAAALSCYMLSLNVAAERAELAKLEWRIIAAKQDIRSLQTELGTRGRLQQLESWNANILALSAPSSAQLLDSEVTLARFEQREKTIEERAAVQMASAPAEQPQVQQPESQQPQVQQQPRMNAPVRYASAPAPEARSLVQRASLTVGESRATEIKKSASEQKPADKKPPAEAKAPVTKTEAAPKLAEKKLASEAKAPVKKAEAEPKLAEKKPASEAKAPVKKAAAEPKSAMKSEAKVAAAANRPKSDKFDKIVKPAGDAANTEKRGSAGGQ